MRVSFLLSLLLLTVFPARAQNDSWKKLEFLLGKWIGVAGEKDTPLGAGQGGYSFEAELNQKVIIRRNKAVYEKGATHEDLMVIYLDSDKPKAIYFDTEGHVIRYNLTFPSANNVTFESDGTQPGPRYRLSYWMNGPSLDGKFEVAPPGADYKAYMNWKSKKE